MPPAPKKPSPKKPVKPAPRKAVAAARPKASARREPPTAPARTKSPASKQSPKLAPRPAPTSARRVPVSKPVLAKPASVKAPPAPKAVPAKQAPKPAPAPALPPPRPRKPAKSPLTERETETVRAQLEADRETHEREIHDLEVGQFGTSQSELSGEAAFDEEYADAGTFTFERERDLSLGNNIRDLLDKVNHALHKIGNGTYGVCERCGEPIEKIRLKALPHVSLCIRCKQLEERVR